jgi:hypothetical protein
MQNPRSRVSRLRLLLAALLAVLAGGSVVSAADVTTIATHAVLSVEALAYTYDVPLYSASDRDAAAKHSAPALPANAHDAVDYSLDGVAARNAQPPAPNTPTSHIRAGTLSQGVWATSSRLCSPPWR